MVEFSTDRSGTIINLTPSQAKEVFARVRSALEKGNTNIGSPIGVDPGVFKAGNFLVSQVQRRAFISGISAENILLSKSEREFKAIIRRQARFGREPTITETERVLQQSLLPEFRTLAPELAAGQIISIPQTTIIAPGVFGRGVDIIPRTDIISVEREERLFTPAPIEDFDPVREEITTFGIGGVGTLRERFREIPGEIKERILGAPTREEFIRAGARERLETQFQEFTPEQLTTLAGLPGTGIISVTTPEGSQFTFQPTKEQIRIAREEAVGEFGALPLRQRISPITAEIGVGAVRGVVGLAEFGLEIAFPRVELIEPGQEISPFGEPTAAGRLISEREFVRELREKPVGIAGIGAEIVTGVGAPLALGAPRFIKLAKEFGIKGAIGETALAISPIKPAKRFFPDISKEPIVGEAFDIGIEGAIIRPQVFVGRGRAFPELKVGGVGVGFEIPSGKPVTAGISFVETPFFEIAPGVKFKTGTIAEIRPFVSEPLGKEFPITGVIPTGRDIGFGIPFQARAVETRFPFARERAFVGERRLAEIDIGRIRIEETFFGVGEGIGFRKVPARQFGKIIEPEIFFPQITGRGRRITIKRPEAEDRGFQIVAPSGLKILTLKMPIKPTTTLVSGIQKSLIEFKPPTIEAPTQILIPPRLGGVFDTRTPSIFAGTGLFERTEQVSIAFPKTITERGLIQVGDFARDLDRAIPSISGFEFGALQLEEQRFKPARGLFSEKLASLQFERQIPIQTTLLGSATAQDFDFPRIPLGFVPFDFRFPRAPAPRGRFGLIPPFLPPLGFFEPKRRKVKAKRKFKREPSLIAVALDITAPEPVPGEITGIVARPILV